MKKSTTISILLLLVSFTLQAHDFVWHRFDKDTSISLIDTLPRHEDYVMITVHSSNISTPQHLWRVIYNDSSYVGKTTHGFYTHRFYSQYENPRCNITPQIELTRQGFKASSTDTAFQIIFGAIDTFPNTVRWHEIAYFPYSLSVDKSLSFQTYLALKYGITLDASNYTSSNGTMLWSVKNDGEYYNRIVGIGFDSIYKWKSSCSIQSEDELTLELYSDSLSQGEIYILGDDDNAMSFTHRDTLSSVLYRTWRIKYFSNESTTQSTVGIKIPPSDLGCIEEGFALVHYPINKNDMNYHLILPDSITSEGYAYFNNISIDEDSSGSDCIGILGYQQANRAKAQTDSYTNLINETNKLSTSLESFMKVDITPNPSNGPYQINITLSDVQNVVVKIYDSRGSLIEEQHLSGASEYQHSGTLSRAQIYIIEISSKVKTEQYKYIVK